MIEKHILGALSGNFALVAVLYYFFNAAVDNLPLPTKNSKPLYRFVYGFAHTLAGNLSRAGAVSRSSQRLAALLESGTPAETKPGE